MTRKIAQVLMVGMMLGAGGGRLWAETPAPPCAAQATVPSQVRPWGCRTAAIVTEGMARSATFRRLVERVGQLNGIVYITDSHYVNFWTRRVLSGALSHRVTTAGAYRMLHLMVAPDPGDRRLLTMAHELQHAIEVLEATDVATEDAVDRLFDRIGMQTSAGVVETQAALVVERAVARELSESRKR